MKEQNTIWSTIKNGIKRAIKFVIDVLLFIPRVIFRGLCSVIGDWFDEDETDEADFSAPPATPKAPKPVAIENSKPETKILPSKEEISKIPGVKVLSTENPEVIVTTPVDENLPENFAVKTSERKKDNNAAEEKKVAAATNDVKVAVVPSVEKPQQNKKSEKPVSDKVAKEENATEAKTETTVTADAVAKVDGEVVEAEVLPAETKNQCASNTNEKETAKSESDEPTHIDHFRHDDIGWMELQALDNMQIAMEPENYDPNRNFVHPDNWGGYTSNAVRFLLMAWTQRLGFNPSVSFEKDNNRHFEEMLNYLVSNNFIPNEFAYAMKSRACKYCVMMPTEASKITQDIYRVISGYFYMYYGEPLIDAETFSDKWGESRVWFAKHDQKPEERYSDEDAKKYLPLPKKESIKHQQQCGCGHNHTHSNTKKEEAA